MHGLINRSIQHFLSDTYGTAIWSEVAAIADAPAQGFEAMATYDDGLTHGLLDAAALRLRKPRATLLEDYGNYLVSLEPLRRLMRFGGVDYADFLASLDELPGRAELAVPELALPPLDLRLTSPGRYAVVFQRSCDGFGAVLAGILRAMADDYGALALIDHHPHDCSVEVELLDARIAGP